MPKKKTSKKKEVEEDSKNGQVPSPEEKIAEEAASPEESQTGDVEAQEEELSIEDELKSLQDRHLRLRAELDNYRKRKEKEFSRLLRYEGETVILSFLSIADDLHRMIDSVDGEKPENVESMVEGMSLILEKLQRRLADLGVEPFDSEGTVFDPDLHDAMMTESSDEHDDGVVIQEFEKGYKYKDKVIRHAKVIVNAKEKTEE